MSRSSRRRRAITEQPVLARIRRRERKGEAARRYDPGA
jgi:hypothetical protein